VTDNKVALMSYMFCSRKANIKTRIHVKWWCSHSHRFKSFPLMVNCRWKSSSWIWLNILLWNELKEEIVRRR